ncbi:unnamed protein product [Prorocentrum cordatum]|uniref:FACT complex subunit n=1 Tax=Prorocentrum cordatum TaxID=2364126 RepID=A0ABN9SF80_9DINO|nr:unnamed protein product [Polarella glacialis]
MGDAAGAGDLLDLGPADKPTTAASASAEPRSAAAPAAEELADIFEAPAAPAAGGAVEAAPLGDDLLEQPAPAAAGGGAAAAPLGDDLLEAAAPAAPTAAAAAADAFGDDDWDAFQSAPTGAGPAAAAPAEAADGGAGAGAAAAPGSAEAELFDPVVAPSEAPKTPDPYSGLVDALEKKHAGAGADRGAGGSFGANDEFDPVAQAWAKGQTEAPGQAQPPAATSSAVAGEDFDPDPLAPERPKPVPVPAGGGGPGGDLLGIGGGATGSGAPAAEDDDFVLDATHGIDLEPEKKQIFVYFKGEKNVVGWYSDDMKAGDIKEAVLCACDAIIDGGFVLREVVFTGDDESTAEPAEDGKTFDYEDFGDLQHGQTYIIEAAQERDDLKKFTGDRWRRLKVQVEPLLHVEAVKAIDRMKRGSNLLKHTHYGFPHLRQFQLSDDRKRLIWYSGAKRKEDSVIQLEDVIEIRLGQSTPVFLHYRLPMLEHLSFSLVYGANGSKSLDLTCKDEIRPLGHWTEGNLLPFQE